MSQIVDTGLDTTSCFFADADGEEVEHGHYFETVRSSDSTGSDSDIIFNGGSFPVDLTRRKVRRRERND